MINSKLTRQPTQISTEERLFKLLESIDWKLWEMMNMMKAQMPEEEPVEPKKVSLKSNKKTVNQTEE